MAGWQYIYLLYLQIPNKITVKGFFFKEDKEYTDKEIEREEPEKRWL